MPLHFHFLLLLAVVAAPFCQWISIQIARIKTGEIFDSSKKFDCLCLCFVCPTLSFLRYYPPPTNPCMCACVCDCVSMGGVEPAILSFVPLIEWMEKLSPRDYQCDMTYTRIFFCSIHRIVHFVVWCSSASLALSVAHCYYAHSRANCLPRYLCSSNRGTKWNGPAPNSPTFFTCSSDMLVWLCTAIPFEWPTYYNGQPIKKSEKRTVDWINWKSIQFARHTYRARATPNGLTPLLLLLPRFYRSAEPRAPRKCEPFLSAGPDN